MLQCIRFTTTHGSITLLDNYPGLLLSSSQGGLRGVVWADLFQGVVIFGGIITILAVVRNQLLNN